MWNGACSKNAQESGQHSTILKDDGVLEAIRARATFSKRLQRLETRMMPVGEPLVIQVQNVSPDGSVKDGPRISVPGAGGRRVGKGPR